MKKELRDCFSAGFSPDLKHFKVTIFDLEACADPKIQDHIHTALRIYLRKLRKQKGSNHGNA